MDLGFRDGAGRIKHLVAYSRLRRSGAKLESSDQNLGTCNGDRDDEGRLTLTLALESDPDVTVVGILPVEANRTRGLSILGPEGHQHPKGLGSLDQWRWHGSWSKILEMRLRAETGTWSSTEWGDDLKLYDSAQEKKSLECHCSHFRSRVMSLEVPGSQNGENVSTILEPCVGREKNYM